MHGHIKHQFKDFHINRITVEFKLRRWDSIQSLLHILIESQWNLNDGAMLILGKNRKHINRITVEFK